MANYHKTSDEINLEIKQIDKAKKNPMDFEPLYNAYFDSVYKFVFNRVSSYDQAGDISSQVFLKALQHLNNYTFKGVPFSAWLFRIASNEVNQFYRDRKKCISISIDEVQLKSFIDEFDDNDHSIDKDIVLKAIGQLPKSSVDLIQMRFFEDHSFREIADIYNITENNAKVKVYRILEKIKKMMTKIKR